MKDNRKHLKEGFVYPGTSKEEREKNISKASLPGSQPLSRRQREQGLCVGPCQNILYCLQNPHEAKAWIMSSLGPNTLNPKREEEGISIMALWIGDFHFFFFKSTRTLSSKEIAPGSPKWKTNKMTKVEVLSASKVGAERGGLGSWFHTCSCSNCESSLNESSLFEFRSYRQASFPTFCYMWHQI